MGYKKSDNTYKETIKFDGDLNVISTVDEDAFHHTITYENIVIINNEDLYFDLTNYVITRENVIINTPIKIIVDYGDNSIVKYTKPLKTVSNEKWNKFSHKYSVTNPEYFDKTNILVVKIINLEGYTDTLKIPFKILQTSNASFGMDFELLYANLTNEKKVSFVLNNKSNRQIIFVSNSK